MGLEALMAERKALNEKISAIEQAENDRQNAQFIGKFFKTPNCYSCPESDEDYWSVYFHPTKFQSYMVSGVMFQTDTPPVPTTQWQKERKHGKLQPMVKEPWWKLWRK